MADRPDDDTPEREGHLREFIEGGDSKSPRDSHPTPEETPFDKPLSDEHLEEPTTPDEVIDGRATARPTDALPRDFNGGGRSEDIDPDFPDDQDSDDPAEFIEEIESSQEYIQITPVREEVNSETVTRELYGLHRYGTGRKLPLDMELHIDSINPVSNFEFIIYKPEGEAQFKFFLGPGERGDTDCDRLESTTRSQYPENFEFDRQQFDITDVFDDVPHMVRFEGVEERRKDWMTMLTRFDTENISRSPLSNLLETIIQTDGAVVFQVIFEPRSDWSPKAQRQKGRLKRGVHTTGGMVIRSILDAVIGVSDEERQERHRGETPQEIGGSIMDSQVGGDRPGNSRMGQIDLKDPSHTYNVSLRAAAQSQHCAETLQDSLNQMSGQFYSIEGKYLEQNENEYKRMLNHGITYPNGWEMVTRRKPILVCNIDELASFITVPSIDALPKASRGGTGGKPKAQSALTSPNEEVFKEFSNGMTIGHAVTALRDDTENESEISAIDSVNQWWTELNKRDALSLSAGDLTHHYIRAATTGSGKTVATLNDMLSTHDSLDGPTILIDPKGGEMCRNYLRCHRTLFGDLDDVEYVKVPEKDGHIPGVPFFDIRPLTRGAGRERETAVQDIIDHYFQLLRFVLGRETVDQAFVANEILTNLIKGLFDEEHGSDYFAIGDLLQAAQDFQHYGREIEDVEKASQDDIQKALPPIEDEQVRSILTSHMEKEERQFMNTTDAVLNRIRKLKERDFIWDMLSFVVPEEHWNDNKNWYERSEVSMLDLKNILNTNKVLLVDTGDLRGESSEVFTVLFLSHLWTSVQSIWTPNDDDYIANVIIEESANIARNEIVYNELLPKGREFNLSLGLIMQYPEQVLGEDPRGNRRAYQEILNNVNTKIIGNIATDDLLANSLFHEDLDTDEIKDRIAGLRRGEWVVQLPSTGFHKQKPEILTLKPLPIPPGHSEGPFNVTPMSERVREESRDRHCLKREDELIRAEVGSEYMNGGGDSGGSSTAETSIDVATKANEVNEEFDTEIDIGELNFRHKAFLDTVFDALTGNHDSYSLGEPMTVIQYNEHADDLVDWGLLEKVMLPQKKLYYFPTSAAEVFMERSLSPDEGGELGGESPKHLLGVRMAAEVYKQRGYDVSLYPDSGDSNKLDVRAADTKASPSDRNQLIEVETSPEKKGHVLEDYETLKEGYGDGVWVVENTEAVRTLVNNLSEKLDGSPSTRSENVEKISEELNDTGAAAVHTLNSLRKKLE
ncbi:ATP-binding protein (plasmid) [Haloplanus ruber]|uniref:ATP-binding protein n=1 Tax=Haloplanus ruber TaxID=869892 RepID=A0ABD6D2Z9_9EURY|nr:ATP-binding protein [Haloplanus ruber]